MTFADNYFVRYKALPPFFPLPTSVSLPSYKAPDMIVIIPCLDDECIFYTLSSLDAAAERANTGNLQKLIFSRPATEEKAEFTDVNEHFDEGAKRRKNNFS
ncbi:MAG: hypothetical protein LBD53_06235, partial [Tannerella sp.]|nr:hypothetical protein [Tannerella sp.]